MQVIGSEIYQGTARIIEEEYAGWDCPEEYEDPNCHCSWCLCRYMDITMANKWYSRDPHLPMNYTKGAGPRLNIKTVLSTYGVFHIKDKTAVRTSYL